MIYRTDHHIFVGSGLHLWRTYDRSTYAPHARLLGRQQVTNLLAPQSKVEYAGGFTVEVPGVATPRPPAQITAQQT
jgi:hypothetical protein